MYVCILRNFIFKALKVMGQISHFLSAWTHAHTLDTHAEDKVSMCHTIAEPKALYSTRMLPLYLRDSVEIYRID